MRRLAVLLLLSAAAAACSRGYERPVNGWCKVRVREPVRLGGGSAQAGGADRDTVLVRGPRPDRWKEVAKGTGGLVARLAEDHVVLFVPSLGAPGVVIAPDGSARPLAEVFPCEGIRTTTPDGRRMDCGRCTEGAGEDCRAVGIEPFSFSGGRAESTRFAVANASCRFRQTGVRWYDQKGRAYLLADCAGGARILYRVGASAEPERFADPKGTEDARSWYEAIGRIELLDPKPLHRIRGKANEPIPR
jgi:hypothetical protein